MEVSATCPSCARRLAPIEAAAPGGATRVYDRTCRRCGETWRIVARPGVVGADGVRYDRLDLAFVGHRGAGEGRDA